MMRRTTRVVSDQARRIADLLDQVLDEHLAPGATFEQRQDLAAAVASDAPWLRSDRQLQAMVTTADDLAVDDRRYRRLEQPSSATYDGRWGSHELEEPLYREVGVHDGPTIKPIELRAGIIEPLTPDMARVVGELSADKSSRGGLAAMSRRLLNFGGGWVSDLYADCGCGATVTGAFSAGTVSADA